MSKREIKRIKTGLIHDELREVKKRLTAIQRLLNKGRIDDSIDELRKIVTSLEHIRTQIGNSSAQKELEFAIRHLDRCISLLFDEYINELIKK